MSRLIDADALAEILEKVPAVDIRNTGGQAYVLVKLSQVFNAIDTQPTIEERKTGRWILNDNGTWSCDKCHSWIPDEQHYYAEYCLFCGAKMEVEHDQVSD